MATVFLVGGTGNHLFQFTRAEPQDRFSYAFLRGPIHRLLGWTEHPRLFEFPKAGIAAQGVAMLVLAVDLVLAKLLRVSLFSRIDLRALKAEPVIKRLVQIGYFQKVPATRPIDDLRPQITAWSEDSVPPETAMHIRGGDILAYQQKGRNPYGVLPTDYYRRALEQATMGTHVTVFTDDRARASELLKTAGPPGLDYTIDDGSLDDMIAGCAGADSFIACNSTLSYWILQLRGPERHSIAPAPFTASLDIELPGYVEGIPVSFS